MLLVQHDTDLLTFDEMVKLFTSLTFRAQLINQNRPKIYISAPRFNSIYVLFSPPTTMNIIPTQHQVTTIYTNPFYFPTDQNDPVDFSTTNRGFK